MQVLRQGWRQKAHVDLVCPHEGISLERGKERSHQGRARRLVRTHSRCHRNSGLLDILSHPHPEKCPRQRVLVVACDGYACLVPFVEEEAYYFLKTIIPSRKATRDYLNRGETDAED